MNINMNGNKVEINGKAYNGKNIQISNGSVVIDGKEEQSEVEGLIRVEIHGDVENVETASGHVIAKNVQFLSTQSGDVDCDNVTGSVSTMSGDVNFEKIEGNVSTMSGDITRNIGL